jgi:hypothetical protein
MTNRNTPVSIAGLSSGIVMVALGSVSRVCDSCVAFGFEGAGLLSI